MDHVDEWIERAWAELSSLPGLEEVMQGQRSVWEEYSRSEAVEVVVFGAYDAGKSSLLKRLLVDWGAEPPAWLTISGRRETFEAKRVEVDGYAFTDTPGLGSGNAEHDVETLQAMRLADAYIWVLPPQLVTTGKQHFVDLLLGETGIASATIAAIARMDEGGFDPADNPSGFKELCERKEEELQALLEASGRDAGLRHIQCVVADPYQMVGNTPAPAPEFYDTGREWDGIDRLIERIRALRESRVELRRRSGVRFVSHLVSDSRDELRRLSEDLDLSAEALKNEIRRNELSEQRLEALQRQARSELHRGIEDALLSATRSGAGVGAESIRSLEKLLSAVVDEWAEASFAAYRKLVGELELEARERMEGPTMEGFRRLAEEAEKREREQERSGFDAAGLGRKAVSLGLTLRRAFEQYAKADLGMTLKTAASRLESLESSGKTIETFIKDNGHHAAFRGAKHAEKASQYVKWARVIDAVGPLVEQLGGALLEVADEMMSAKRAEERAQQRRELRSALRKEAEKLEESAAGNFDAACGGLREWLNQRKEAINEGLAGIEAQQAALAQATGSLASVLHARPAPHS